MTYVGIDQHSTQLTLHFLTVSADSTIDRSTVRCPIDSVQEKLLSRLDENCAVCIEAGNAAFFLAGLVMATGAQSYVVNPMDMRLIWDHGKKTDRVDAKKLADTLRRHIEDDDPDDGFPQVFIPDEQAQELRALVAHYLYLTTSRNRIRNRMYAILRHRMIATKRQSLPRLLSNYLEHAHLSDNDRFMLAQLEAEYAIFDKQRAETQERITRLGVLRFPRETRILISIHGVSLFGAVAMMTDIVTVKRFRTRKHFSSYLRSAPRVDASNETVRIGRINKRGKHLTFTLLLESARHLLDANPSLRAYVARSSGKSNKKLRAAIVGKTIVTIFYMLKNEEASRYVVMSSYERKLRQLEKYENLAQAA